MRAILLLWLVVVNILSTKSGPFQFYSLCYQCSSVSIFDNVKVHLNFAFRKFGKNLLQRQPYLAPKGVLQVNVCVRVFHAA